MTRVQLRSGRLRPACECIPFGFAPKFARPALLVTRHQVRHVVKRLAAAMRGCERSDVVERSSCCGQGSFVTDPCLRWHVHQPCRCLAHLGCSLQASHVSVGHSGPNALLPLSGALTLPRSTSIDFSRFVLFQPHPSEMRSSCHRRPPIPRPCRCFGAILNIRLQR